MFPRMRNLLFVSALAISAISAAGCSKKSDGGAPAAGETEAKIATVSVDQLDTMLASNQCQAVDANGDETRKKMGVVPGAILLKDSSDKFDAAQLPADKSKALVFYCGNTACRASHEAAQNALTAGYTNVKVMPDGIAGWVKSGKKVTQI
jgi:rhodanese-related sulfurtransferase